MKVYIESYGCSTNQALGEYLEGMLVSHGLEIASEPEKADFIVINTCTVKARTERRMVRRIKEIDSRYENKNLVVAGCMPTVQRELLDSVSPDSIKFGTNEYHLIPPAIKDRHGNEEKEKVPFGDRPLHRPGIGIVPISSGCLGRCTYCVVRRIKGDLRSYPMILILEEVQRLVDKGVHELWLTAQDLAAYGMDGAGAGLPVLLRNILELVDDIRIRLGMMNPSSLKTVLPELLEIYQDPKIYNFIHLPIQSGSDGVLKSMNRRYTVREWSEMSERLRREFQDFIISTDIIVGYPRETEADFHYTLRFLRDSKPDIVNLSKYEHRPGTPASSLKELPGSEVKRRSRKASRTISELTLERNRLWLGWKGECLVSEKGSKGGFVARNDCYKPIIIQGERDLGSRMEVCVVDATENYLIGRGD